VGEFSYNIPKSWEIFQLLTRDLFKQVYGLTFEELGRSGQKQYGIDLIAHIPERRLWSNALEVLGLDDDAENKVIAVQCKKRDTLGMELILKDYKNMEKSPYDVAAWILATSLARDESLQREINEQRSEIPLLKHTLFWDNFEQMLDEYQNVAKRYGFIQTASDEIIEVIKNQNIPLNDKLDQMLLDIKTLKKEIIQETADSFIESESSADKKHPYKETSFDDQVSSQLINELINQSIESLVPDRLTDRFSQKEREKKFFMRKFYNDAFKRFIEDTKITEQNLSSLPESILKIILPRLLGLSALIQTREKDLENPITITLEVSLDEPSSRSLKSLDEIETFLQWTKQFTDFKEEKFDRELLQLDVTKPSGNLFKFMEKRFGYASIGMMRWNKLLNLQMEMLKHATEIIEETNPVNYWNLLVGWLLNDIRDVWSGRIRDYSK
jgi:hypothetical protein